MAIGSGGRPHTPATSHPSYPGQIDFFAAGHVTKPTLCPPTTPRRQNLTPATLREGSPVGWGSATLQRLPLKRKKLRNRQQQHKTPPTTLDPLPHLLSIKTILIH